MRAAEKLGLTKEIFKKLYEEYDGFNYQFNKNHPSYDGKENFWNFLNKGSNDLAKSNPDLIRDIIDRG